MELEAEIKRAFAGVTLNDGISALQSESIEEFRRGLTPEEFELLPQSETTDDWTSLSSSELGHVLTPHLDWKGLRYYLPALLIWLLDNYEGSWSDPTGSPMPVIWAIMALAPPQDSRKFWWRSYEDFTAQQKTAIARYVSELPQLVRLRPDDVTALSDAANEYWNRFLH